MGPLPLQPPHQVHPRSRLRRRLLRPRLQAEGVARLRRRRFRCRPRVRGVQQQPEAGRQGHPCPGLSRSIEDGRVGRSKRLGSEYSVLEETANRKRKGCLIILRFGESERDKRQETNARGVTMRQRPRPRDPDKGYGAAEISPTSKSLRLFPLCVQPKRSTT